MKLLLVLLTIASVALAAVDDVAVNNFKVGILAKDQQPSDENLKTVALFSKLPNELKADASQRLYVSFTVAKKSDNAKVKPHQVFLRFVAQNGEDVVVVVNPDANGNYVYDNVLRTAAKSFRNLSGQFKISLLVGDVTIKNPINWQFANIDAALPVAYEPTPKSQQVHFEPLNEISHIFRQPEKRPSALISDLFTIICLSPLLILVVLWSQVGINFQNAPASPWVPIFHVGLIGIFGIYFMFWVQFDMFVTLKYLAVLGFLTFVAGNRVLRAISESKQKSE
ncbi:Dolichyl-diphosphooligosaccharide--protein glycosyltransferase subunit 2 [Caenorhabditis elegans]|uniref:Dolichyl-diphosphooligosaccharide--protein glycosyltransferase subunit 2 n=1 Tax=Caenorhabditis elegans TaxID=6239 RepID=RPN2_CAEEL|nr:Dolichyl-diphosphooligosaccharide--protein glycosyltransferase subunit 2 [Caenorhabditis elegans]P91390.1 RecName: Full=Dolichyl-diphosphooligosaccharide--protein glycosyltransferase subunit 2; AltName: Full=Oligosaccharyl transferase delta subunit; AltName: Full=Ribophorin II; Short=RPN-II; AltName: Full=Ribophorin-2; Flags: Precursor [Caenorhabditis elegans]CCD72083.1 Dolichyl-diphosphooligosaccharide--protein glycosyltransferase subunit 2 [Caenorhabditis elegans]|eukprot:NP_491624.1 Dolichyl-diphosphooligosaccharide--protein glycosyltransferase subunit 2 [Caenorhabditis elegans]